MPARKVTHEVRAHGCKNDHTHIRPFACRSDSSGLWPGCLLCVWVVNLPWVPVASSRVDPMPPVIAVNLSLHTDANPILNQSTLSISLTRWLDLTLSTRYHQESAGSNSLTPDIELEPAVLDKLSQNCTSHCPH